MDSHQKKCLRIGKDESFLKYHARKTGLKTSDKILPPSQPANEVVNGLEIQSKSSGETQCRVIEKENEMSSFTIPSVIPSNDEENVSNRQLKESTDGNNNDTTKNTHELTKSSQEPSINTETHECSICQRNFKTGRGLKKHFCSCQRKMLANNTDFNKPMMGPPPIVRGAEIIPDTSKHSTLSTLPTLINSEPLIWGSLTKDDVVQMFNSMYDEVVHWRRNLFLLPSGQAGKSYIRETTRLLQNWVSDSNHQKNYAMKAVMIMPGLLLQKPSFKSKAKEHAQCLQRRLALWENGEFDALMSEARAIQSKSKNQDRREKSPEHLAKTFAKHVLKGNVNAAIRLLDEMEYGGVLPLTKNVLDELAAKHPSPASPDPEVLIKGVIPFVDPALFNNIDEESIAKAAMKTKGAAGPSGLDADGWRRILVSKQFGSTSKDLRTVLADVARRLCTEIVVQRDENSSSSIETYVACRLIPLDKNGEGVRPIGIGEVIRRIIGKALMAEIKPDVLESAGSLQLCAGHQSGCEAAVHAMAEIFEEEGTDALLFIDASNAFNSINRSVLLHNIQYLCPPMATYIWNCYATPSRLFITGGGEIQSKEGTTQGCTLAMPAYGVGITPLLTLIRPKNVNTTRQAAYADDLAGAEKLQQLKEWWHNIERFGPLLGYYPKASKSWLVVKEKKFEEAQRIFSDTDINITTEGRKYLGGYIGKGSAKSEYNTKLVSEWVNQVEKLCTIAKSEPQAAYSAFVTGFKHKLNYHMRTIPLLTEHLKPLDDIIDLKFIPAITDGHICSVLDRELLSLPVKLGGLGIPIFFKRAINEYKHSVKASSQFVENIKKQTEEYVFDQKKAKEVTSEIKRSISKRNEETLKNLRVKMNAEQQRANELCQLKGASSWLTTLPLQSENFVLNKREFFDAIALR